MPPARRTRSKVDLPPAPHPDPEQRTTIGHEHGQLETQGTAVSLATLPPKYAVYAALSAREEPLRAEEASRRRQEAEELLSDGWRRDAAQEGKLSELRARKRRRVTVQDEETLAGPSGASAKVETRKDKLDVLWYTAELAFPCSCKQPSWSHRFKPRHPPPLAKRLHPLPSPSPDQLPQIGGQLEEWASPALVGLDPTMNDLEDFEHGWKSADGGWGRGWDYESIDTRSIARSPAKPPPSGAEDRAPRNGKWKGKERAIALEVEMPPPSGTPAASAAVPIPLEVDEKDIRRRLAGQTTLVETITPTPDVVQVEAPSWQEEAKRRKGWWRKTIKEEGGYGRISDIVPLPHSFPALMSGHSRYPTLHLFPLPGAFVLPRALSLPDVQHPYHPDLARYIRKNPHGRVYWLIPVHGPVLVPSLHGPFGSAPPNSLPVPSPACLADSLPVSGNSGKNQESGRKSDRFLRWTPSLLRHFLDAFLLPLYRDPLQPLGSISIAISGPKPDPWINLPSKPPLQEHLFAGSKSPHAKGPERVEAGDHIRIYCDAKYALILRTWLYGIEYDPRRLDSLEEGEKKEKRERVQDGPSPTQSATPYRGRVKMFQRVRLALVGSRQEVLTVA